MLKYVSKYVLKNVAVVVVCLTLSAIASSQSKPATVNAAEIQQIAAEREAIHNNGASEPRRQQEQDQIARLIVERQNQLRLDTQKLVALTAELKEHVDKSGANILSMDVIKKAQEIQKLAKSVQDKMKTAY
jgi:hypothetical protein